MLILFLLNMPIGFKLTVNKGYFLITLSSNFYFESTLKEIVQSALQLN